MRIVFVLVVLLIAYGSLFPFRFVAVDLSHLDGWRWLFDFSARTTRGDIVGNILLFLPLGLFGALSIEQWADHRKRLRWVSYFVLITGGLGYALLLQVLQLYLPTRIASATDVWCNFLGLLLGVAAARMAFSHRWNRWLQSEQRASRVSIALFLCGCWLGYLWFPFIPSLSWHNLLDSFHSLTLWQQLTWYGVVDKLIAWSLFWYYLSQLSPWQKQWKHRLALLAVISLVQLLMRNHLSLPNLMGALLSLFLFYPVQRIPHRLIAWGLLGWLMLRGLIPFDWAPQTQSFHWLPFVSFLQGPLWLYSFVLFEKIFFFAACFDQLRRVTRKDWLAAAIMALALLLVEVVQLRLQNRISETTEPLMALLLALGLSQIHKRSMKPLGQSGSSAVSK